MRRRGRRSGVSGGGHRGWGPSGNLQDARHKVSLYSWLLLQLHNTHPGQVASVPCPLVPLFILHPFPLICGQ